MTSTPPPLPARSVLEPAELLLDDTLITADRENLPPGVAEWLDPAMPLPPDVQLFEKRVSLGDVLFNACWAIGLSLLGALSLVFGIDELIHPIGPVTVSSQPSYWPIIFGFTCGIGAWVMSTSIPEQFRLRAAQRAGQPTRVGIFISGNVLVEATVSANTLIPRSCFVGVADRTLKYTLSGEPKSFRLPPEYVDVTPAVVTQAIRLWAGIPAA